MGCSKCNEKKKATIALQNDISDLIDRIKKSRNVKTLNIKKEFINGTKKE